MTSAHHFIPLERALAQAVEEFGLPGAAVEVYLEGERVSAAAAGDWNVDDLVDVASVSKAATALSLLQLVDTGRVLLDAPVADYWPSFRGHGKDAVLVRHLLTHEAGLPGIASPELPADVWLEWHEMVGWLAREPLWWAPGACHGYHPYTFGHLVGQVVRLVTGHTVGQFFRSTIGDPLGIDFHIGLDGALQRRVVDLVRLPLSDGPPRPHDPAGPLRLRLNNPIDAGIAYRNSSQWRRAEVPATNGHASVSGVARLAALIAERGVLDGRRFCSEELMTQAVSTQTAGPDVVLADDTQYGLGLTVLSDGVVSCQGGGGCLLYADVHLRLAIGYVQKAALPRSDPTRTGRLLVEQARALALA